MQQCEHGRIRQASSSLAKNRVKRVSAPQHVEADVGEIFVTLQLGDLIGMEPGADWSAGLIAEGAAPAGSVPLLAQSMSNDALSRCTASSAIG